MKKIKNTGYFKIAIPMRFPNKLAKLGVGYMSLEVKKQVTDAVTI